ncbi:MAG TPA: efflux RND transporter periplasmic adaptor subunit [Rhizomicrobium sp.]|jgi:multidrug efflux system membrane fusion protein|nr:efflux RND transporter periplasmic adaptor subunit [Rhizomicrobium sp.]
MEWLDNIYRRVMPGFWLRMKPQYQWATGIFVVVVLWIASGMFGRHGGPSEPAAANIDETPTVQVSAFPLVPRDATITVRGRTEAKHSVDVRAEVEGVVEAMRFEKGDRVRKGQVLCQIRLNARGSMAAQANALVQQRAKEYEVASTLYKDGYRSKTQLAQADAALSAAKASAATAAIQVADTQIKAPFDGFANDRYVEAGDYMRAGDKCAQVVAPEPFLAVGTVSEQDVGQITDGGTAQVKLVTGETVPGKVTFISTVADPQTRTFQVEVTVPNPDNKLRDGVSADIAIPVRKVMAQHVSSGILVLDESGEVGVRTVDRGVVHFKPVKLISDGPDGTWIAGLAENTNIIIRGQNFVAEGQRVKVDTSKGGA